MNARYVTMEIGYIQSSTGLNLDAVTRWRLE